MRTVPYQPPTTGTGKGLFLLFKFTSIASGAMSSTSGVPPLELPAPCAEKEEVMLEIEGTDCTVRARNSSLL